MVLAWPPNMEEPHSLLLVWDVSKRFKQQSSTHLMTQQKQRRVSLLSTTMQEIMLLQHLEEFWSTKEVQSTLPWICLEFGWTWCQSLMIWRKLQMGMNSWLIVCSRIQRFFWGKIMKSSRNSLWLSERFVARRPSVSLRPGKRWLLSSQMFSQTLRFLLRFSKFVLTNWLSSSGANSKRSTLRAMRRSGQKLLRHSSDHTYKNFIDLVLK